MDLFRTIVEVPENSQKLDYMTASLWVGSCFAENIGSRLKELKFTTGVNPFGVLYNPESIRNSINILTEKRLFTAGDLQYGNDLWYSFFHHSSFSHPDQQICLGKINDSINSASLLLKNASFLFITFGTARVYKLKETGAIVSNNHKLPHNRFNNVLLEVNEIVDAYTDLIGNLQRFNSRLKLVFTLSPVRHWKDGATGNLVSKSTLMLAIAKLQKAFDNVSYFPAYEIVMDELRDYRFYADDMIHINRQGVDYIWKRFNEAFVRPDVYAVIKRVEDINRAIEHRPFNPESVQYIKFLSGILQRINEIESSFSTIDFTREKAIISDRLENL